MPAAPVDAAVAVASGVARPGLVGRPGRTPKIGGRREAVGSAVAADSSVAVAMTDAWTPVVPAAIAAVGRTGVATVWIGMPVNRLTPSGPAASPAPPPGGKIAKMIRVSRITPAIARIHEGLIDRPSDAGSKSGPRALAARRRPFRCRAAFSS